MQITAVHSPRGHILLLFKLMAYGAVLQRFMLVPFAVFHAHKIVIVPSWGLELGATILIQIIVVVIIQRMIRLLLLSQQPR